MAEIQEVRIGDIVSELPELVPWDDREVNGSRITLLIVCAGFEDRAVAIADAVKDASIDELLIIEYPTNPEDNADAIATLSSIPAKTVERLQYDRREFFHQIQSRVAKMSSVVDVDVIVDVSAMASYVVSRTFAALWGKLPGARLRVFYAEADEYHPTESAWKEFFESVTDPDDNLAIAERYEQTYFQAKGVEETYECDVFSGRNQGPVATELIAIPSFSLQRVKSMTAYAEAHYNVSPQETHWFLGRPPDKRKNGWRFEALGRLYNVKARGTPVDTRDYRDVIRRLDELWSESVEKERHLIVAGMGSKMQNLGVFLFMLMHGECGLLHCEPKEFIANRYTDGVGPRWEIDFGSIDGISNLLSTRQELVFSWA